MESSRHRAGIELFWLVLRCRELDKDLATLSGLTIDELHCLAVVSLRRPTHVRQLSDILGLTSSRTSKVLKSVEKKGLLRRLHHPLDRRKGDVVLTAPGKAMVEKTVLYLSAARKKLLESTTDGGVAQLVHQVLMRDEQPVD